MSRKAVLTSLKEVERKKKDLRLLFSWGEGTAELLNEYIDLCRQHVSLTTTLRGMPNDYSGSH